MSLQPQGTAERRSGTPLRGTPRHHPQSHSGVKACSENNTAEVCHRYIFLHVRPLNYWVTCHSVRILNAS